MSFAERRIPFVIGGSAALAAAQHHEGANGDGKHRKRNEGNAEHHSAGRQTEHGVGFARRGVYLIAFRVDLGVCKCLSAVILGGNIQAADGGGGVSVGACDGAEDGKHHIRIAEGGIVQVLVRDDGGGAGA